MILKEWDELPQNIRLPEVRPYYDVLYKKRIQLIIKRIFDLTMAIVLLIILSIPMAILSIMIRIDSEGPALFRQERVTIYGRHFMIHKFRTMVNNADKLGTSVTADNDSRITKLGKILRKSKLDELPQLFDVIAGNMSFVGTRPEALKYVNEYLPVYMATLLLPAGITSEASIRYKNEEKLLDIANDVDKVYIEEILPEKMIWNLSSIENFSLLNESFTLFRTIFTMLGKDYN